ncbi:MAG TPA: sugar ABC transporter ATP-binding protein [Pseudonocardiaceae bacterium]|jgi:simple sugar transport system ATP-binding protein|nr:sugar ABC transporter ATP-binding protein [Pseudonocardiaceae bacterium]
MTEELGSAVTPLVSASGVTKRYGATVALNDAGIVIERGQTHALVGRNGAGKSTLVSILTGLQRADAGELAFDGRPVPPVSDREGWQRLVACVYQRSTIIPTLSVAENLFLNRQSGSGPIGWRALRQRAQELLDAYELDVNPRGLAEDLSVEQLQLVEIARALSLGARFVILDEPTAQLEGKAIQRLFTKMRALRDSGVTFLFISHHLQEVFDVCDTVTVFRDAGHVLTRPVAEITPPELVEAMTGESAKESAGTNRPGATADAEVVLAARDLTLSGEYTEVDLAVRAGEVVGVAGIGGSGKVALAETLVGLRAATSGAVEITGRARRAGSVPAALAAGLGFVPQDRHRQGLVPLLSVAENATLTITDRLGRSGFISPKRRRAVAARAIADLAIKTDGPDQPVGGLSGGNAQKVVLARALANKPKALVLISPTVGVDVRSRESLLEAVDAAAGEGTGVLVVSDEAEDLRVCDRVLVLFQGTVHTELSAGWTDSQLVAAMEGISADVSTRGAQA